MTINLETSKIEPLNLRGELLYASRNCIRYLKEDGHLRAIEIEIRKQTNSGQPVAFKIFVTQSKDEKNDIVGLFAKRIENEVSDSNDEFINHCAEILKSFENTLKWHMSFEDIPGSSISSFSRLQKLSESPKDILLPSEIKDTLTGLKSRAGLLEEDNLIRIKKLANGDPVQIISIDFQGVGLADKFGFAKALENVFVKFPSLVQESFGERDVFDVARLGGDEFALIVRGKGSGTKASLRMLNKLINQAIKANFDTHSKRFKILNFLVRRRAGVNSRQTPLVGVLKPIFGAFEVSLNDKDNSELQSTFLSGLNLGDKKVTEFKIAAKNHDVKALSNMFAPTCLDKVSLSEGEKLEIEILNRTGAHARMFRIASSQATNDFERAYYSMKARLAGAVDPSTNDDLLSFKFVQRERASSLLAIERKTDFNVYCLDVKRFGKCNALFGSDIADRRVIREILLQNSKAFLPANTHIRVDGGKVLFICKNRIDSEQLIELKTVIEGSLAELVTRSVNSFGKRKWDALDAKSSQFDSMVFTEASLIGINLPLNNDKLGEVSIEEAAISICPNMTMFQVYKKIEESLAE